MSGSMKLEEGDALLLDFDKLSKVLAAGAGVIPVAVQDADSLAVLVVAYVNQEALDYTLKHGIVAFWSTSRNELWVKGKTSGDVLNLVEVRVNCEQNSLLFLVRPERPGACHTRDSNGNTRPSCYYRRLVSRQEKQWVLVALSAHNETDLKHGCRAIS